MILKTPALRWRRRSIFHISSNFWWWLVYLIYNLGVLAIYSNASRVWCLCSRRSASQHPILCSVCLVAQRPCLVDRAKEINLQSICFTFCIPAMAIRRYFQTITAKEWCRFIWSSLGLFSFPIISSHNILKFSTSGRPKVGPWGIFTKKTWQFGHLHENRCGRFGYGALPTSISSTTFNLGWNPELKHN